MGPPPFDGGNARPLGGPYMGCRPSMGPPPFDGGNRQMSMAELRWIPPSMGPPPFDGGNGSLLPSTSSTVSNLQWGHRLSTVETPPRRDQSVRQAMPSMGPPPFDGGNPGSGRGESAICGAFNGATAFRRWKHRMPALHSRTREEGLQWGHRLSTVETRWARWGRRQGT